MQYDSTEANQDEAVGVEQLRQQVDGLQAQVDYLRKVAIEQLQTTLTLLRLVVTDDVLRRLDFIDEAMQDAGRVQALLTDLQALQSEQRDPLR